MKTIMLNGARACCALMVAGFAVEALAQASYPTRTIRVIVPSSPGGGTDIIARRVTPGLSQLLGQQVIVDNRPGAGTMIGNDLAAKAPPDGYTVLMGLSTLATLPATHHKVPYDVRRDLAPITQAIAAPNILVVHPSLPAKTLKDFAALARATPGKLTYGSAGGGSGTHPSSIRHAPGRSPAFRAARDPAGLTRTGRVDGGQDAAPARGVGHAPRRDPRRRRLRRRPRQLPPLPRPGGRERRRRLHDPVLLRAALPRHPDRLGRVVDGPLRRSQGRPLGARGHGSHRQGLGGALFEQCLYDERGQMLNGNMADYLVPMACEMPDIEVGHVVTPTADSELGAKGAGEAGTAGAPGAVMNAINDALMPFGVRVTDQPFTPERVLRALGKV